MDREREQRILAMHRQTKILEEEIKRDRKRQELPSIRYDPHINIKTEQNDNRQQIVDAEQIVRNSNEQKKESEYQLTHNRNQKEDDLKRKEEYLKKFEQDLLKKEEEMTARIRDGVALEPSPELIVERGKKADTLHFVKPYITPFSGIDPVPKNESSFEDWRVEIRSLIESGEYSDYEVAHLIRNSLKLPAKKAVFTLGSSATSKDIIEKLQNVFGNVASGESVLTEFYTSAQKSDESVTMWGMRLKQIVQRGIEKGQIEVEKRDEMLRTRFWRYSYNKELQNATVVHFDQIKNFDQLRSKVRSEEYWKSTSVSESSANKFSNRKPEGAGATAPVQHQPLNVDPNAKYLREVYKRLETLEEDLKFRKNRRQRIWNKGQNQPHEEQKDKTVPKADEKARTEEKSKNPLNK